MRAMMNWKWLVMAGLVALAVAPTVAQAGSGPSYCWNEARNQRGPNGCDTPLANAASSLEAPAAMRIQNACSASLWLTPGRPGERIGARPIRPVIHPGGRPIQHLLLRDVATTAGNHPIYERAVPDVVRRAWRDLQHESQWRLLGQCSHGELLLEPDNRTRLPKNLLHSR